VTKTWTIEIGNDEKKYKSINFKRKLKTESPTSFSAKIEYDATIDFFDVVEIKRDGISEWKGFIEDIEEDWDDQGRYMNVSGRDTSVILWKKYCEGFTEMDKDMGGFFGQVSAVELIKFLVRCPQSDSVHDFPNNKQGWGMDISRFAGFQAYRTSAGHVDWTKLRRRGYGWRNSGDPFVNDTLEADTADIDNWSHYGSPPYLTVKDANYIHSSVIDQTSSWHFENLPANASGLDSVKVTLWWKPDITWWWWIQSECEIEIWINSESRWQFIGRIIGRDYGWDHGWRYLSIDVKQWLATIDDIDNAKVRFTNKSDRLTTKITYCALGVSYQTGGDQSILDYFDINFNEQDNVVGIYVESRMDNDSYPRNYKVISILDDIEDWSGEVSLLTTDAASGQKDCVVADGTKFQAGDVVAISDDSNSEENEVASVNGNTVTMTTNLANTYTVAANGKVSKGYSEVDPENHISLEDSDETINHDNYQDETAYLYRDYGTPLENFDHRFAFKITFSGAHPHAFIPYCMANNLEDHKTMIDTAGHYYCALSVNSEGMGLYTIRAQVKESHGIGSAYSNAISLNTTYYCRVIKSGTTITIYVYTEESMDAHNLFFTTSFSGLDAGLKFRYRFQALTYNGYEWGLRFSDSFENTLGNWTRSGGDAISSFDAGDKAHGTHSWVITADANEYYYVEEDIIEADDVKLDFYVKLPSPNSEVADTTKAVDGWNNTHSDFTHVNTEPWLHDDDGLTNYIHSSTEGDYDEYYTFADLDSKYQSIDVSTVQVRLKGKITDATSIVINLYFKWLGQDTWDGPYDLTFTDTNWETLAAGLTNYVNTVAKINSLQMKIEVGTITGGGAGKKIELTYAYIFIEGTAYWGRINLAKVYDGDFASGPNPNDLIHGCARVTIKDEATNPEKWKYAIWGNNDTPASWLVESSNTLEAATWYRLRMYVKRGSGDGYVKLYLVEGVSEILKVEKTSIDNDGRGTPDCVTIEGEFLNSSSGVIKLDWARIFTKRPTHTTGYIYSIAHQEIELVSAIANTFRDIIHSWQPQTLDNIRIQITDDDADHGWAISQVYVYYAPVIKYRVYLDGLSEPTGSGYVGGPYIKALSFDSAYSTPIGPLNIGMSRLIDALNSVVGKCHTTYVPFRWWVANDANNTLHIKNRRGSDLSNSIRFVKGTHLGHVLRDRSVEDTVQRLKVIGRGEGKRQEEVSSEWKEDTTAMDTVNTFFEDVITERVNANKEIADLIALIKLSEIADIQDQGIVDVNNDEYDSMAYDVGDDVRITDSLTGLSGAQRLWDIKKVINANGESIALVVGRPWKDQADEWADIYRRLKEIGLVGTVASDWMGEGAKAEKVDVKKVSNFWEQKAKHDEVTIGDNDADPMWQYTPASPPQGDGRNIEIEGERMGLYGPSSGSTTLPQEVEMRWDKTTLNPATDTAQEFLVPLLKEPKMICEAKVFEVTSNSTKFWRPEVEDGYEGDYVEFGLFNQETKIGFLFKVKCEIGGTFKVYARWNLTGVDPDDWEEMEIRTIETNTKYRYEMYYERAAGLFVFNVYDVENEEQYPPSVVVLEVSYQLNVRPLYGKVSGNSDGGTYWARFYIHRWRTEWTRVEV